MCMYCNVIICAIYALHAVMIVTGNANRGQNIPHVVYVMVLFHYIFDIAQS